MVDADLPRPKVKEIQQAWEKNGSDVPDLTGAEFSAFLSSEITRWGDVARQAKLKVE